MESEIQNTIKYDPDFCPQCGTIFPLPPPMQEYMSCVNCKYNQPIDEYKKFSSKRILSYQKSKLFDDQSAINTRNFEGCMVDHPCNKCGAYQMAFYTRQTRSADEGQTIFYECKECGNREIEYS